MKTKNRFKLARTKYNKNGTQSVQKVAAETGITRSLIDDLETDVVKPRGSSYLIVAQLAEYYGVTVDWLIGRDNAPIIYGSTVSEAAAVLGMTDKAANQLKEISGISDIAASAMDDFIKSPHFQKIVKLIIAYLKEMQGFVSLANNPASEPSDIYEIISAYDLCEYYASKEIGTLFTEIKKREISKCTSLKIEDDGRISYHEEWRQDSNAKH